MVATPSQEYRRTDHRVPVKPLQGLDAWVNSMAGRYRRRGSLADGLFAEAQRIAADEKQWKEMSDHDLRGKLREFAIEFRRCGPSRTPAVLGSALAALREASERTLGLRPFPVQLMGALALQRGFLAEMATGEGKTLTAGLAGVLCGWTNRPCHIITANDYLVKRDTEWLKAFYEFCHVHVGCVTGNMPPLERRQGYAAHVTYTTSKEIVADFLRDRLRLGPLQDPAKRLIRMLRQPNFHQLTQEVVMRGLHTAIIDEADSLLIDEAVTPLIISAPRANDDLRRAVITAQSLVAQLEPERDYIVNKRHRDVDLTDEGVTRLDAMAADLPGLFRGSQRRAELVRQGLVAREFFLPGKQYVVVEGKVVIVDEFTGRIMPQRSWRAGLHQAIEAKEGVELTDPTETIARMSFQRFYRLFHRLSGMTGTAREAAGEFWQIYSLPVVRIPTNRPCQRTEAPDRLFADAASKWDAVVESICRVHATGRPVLVGTRSVTSSEMLAGRLRERGVGCRVLNALRLAEEAQIVGEAGEQGQITIATNMAGRGTDIRLARGVAEVGGLHVIATERHESGRIDRQLFGRAARQGDPGSAEAFISAEDDLLTRHLPAFVRNRVAGLLRQGVPSARSAAKTAVAMAQWRAERFAFRQRAAVLRTDTWLDEALAFTGGGKIGG